MSSSPDAEDPAMGTGTRGSVAEAEARDHRDRLALYKARVHGGKPTSLARLRGLERAAAYADARARRARGR